GPGAATVALGLAQGAYEKALAYATARKQFGRPIGDFQGIRWKLADMAIKIDAARLMIHRAAARAGHRFPDALEAAKAKTFAAETAQQVTSEALQIHGAAGYGRTLPLERMLREAPMVALGSVAPLPALVVAVALVVVALVVSAAPVAVDSSTRRLEVSRAPPTA